MGIGIKTFTAGGNGKGCVVLLPGRYGSAVGLMQYYQRTPLRETLFIGLEPAHEWYPPPNGTGDQAQAVAGMRRCRRRLLRHIHALCDTYGLASQQVALAGFSAGAVMALQCAIHTKKPFAACISHSGAILEPRRTPVARVATPFLLMHNRQDDCFRWNERYCPMRRVLQRRGYQVITAEKDTHIGRHVLTDEEVTLAVLFLAPYLGYGENTPH